MTTVLDAPSLRDDFYCSLLAYSATSRCLAIGLGAFVYIWSEARGVITPENLNRDATAHVTSLSYSSAGGQKAILAIGRADGRIVLWNSSDGDTRLCNRLSTSVSCLSFRPTVTKRPSTRDSHIFVDAETLLVGDENGNVHFYSVEWPTDIERDLFDWPGEMTLMCQIQVNSQQICGLSWSMDGDLFACGGNDNICALFDTARIVKISVSGADRPSSTRATAADEEDWTVTADSGLIRVVSAAHAKQRWSLNAAVKAIAFCPWQRGLIAIGGGSNDRCIHFYHTISGACLAIIDCSAQVTSLIWSTTRKEICATFGFAQPDHPYRIAVFAWPSCEQVMAIPWYDEHRALHAIAYPGGPNTGRKNGEGETWWSRTAEEGCIVVATSDASIKFHEVWSEGRRATVGGRGLLGGSEILESLHEVSHRGNESLR
jgi:WD40 repeat protein